MSTSRFAEQLNTQIGNEFAAHHQYVAIAVHYDALTMPAMAAYFYQQAIEERGHAMMMVRFLVDTDREVTIPGTDAPGEPVRRHRRSGRARPRPGEAGHDPDP